MTEQENKQEKPTAERLLKISCHNCMQKLDVTSLPPFSHVNCPTCGMDLIVPKWFDDYLLEEPGGTGGMATVYRALDLALDREVAIKILKPELSHDSAKSELFLREARTAATINHYAVVPIYTCGVCGDQTYIIMQFMGGGSLEQKLRQSPEPLPLLDIMRWISDIAQGLENASIHGIIHHDVKPGNILLDVEGNAKIGDFGIAQIITGPDGKNPETKNWVSPFYVSPEKVRTGEEGIQGDIYSLGATAYHLVTGMPPFNHDDLDELIRMRLTADPTPPHLLRKETGLELSQLILSMMSRNPMERPSYKTITATLVRIIKEQSSSTVPLPVRTFRQKREAVTAAKTRKKRTSAIGLCVVLLLFIAIAGGGVLLWKDKIIRKQTPVSQNAKKELILRTNLSKASAYYFSMGYPEGAFLCADTILRDPHASLHDRATALFQAACSLRLMKDPEASAKIEQWLAGMNNQYNASEMMKENLLISLVANLSNPASDEPIPDAKGPGAACKTFTLFLAALCSGAEDERLESLLSDFQTAAHSAENAWPSAAWLKRSERWMQILQNHSGIKSETEPVLSDRIKTEDSWSGSMPDLLPATPESWMEEESANWDDVPEEEETVQMDDLSPEALKTAADAYANRPRLKSPALLQAWNADTYLASLPEEKQIPEKIRIRMMKEVPRFISEISVRVPYQADSFILADNQTLDAGHWMFNPWFMICSRDNAAKIVSWGNAPAPEVLGILLFYTARMEGMCRTRDTGTRHLLMYYVRYALFALWYENFEEASKYLRKAVTAFPDKKTAAFIRFMFLQ